MGNNNFNCEMFIEYLRIINCLTLRPKGTVNEYCLNKIQQKGIVALFDFDMDNLRHVFEVATAIYNKK